MKKHLLREKSSDFFLTSSSWPMFENAGLAAAFPASTRLAANHRGETALLGDKIGFFKKISFLFRFVLKTYVF